MIRRFTLAAFAIVLTTTFSAADVTYSVKVKTAAQAETGSNANGTDANVKIIISGSSGETELLTLDNPSKNDFETGTNETFSVSGADVGTVDSITISQDGTGNKPGWALEYVEVKKGSDSTVRFPCYRWLASDEDDQATSRQMSAGGSVVYDIRVTTANQKNAGSDANVRVRLVGPDWGSYNRLLDSSKDDFEQGSVQTYPVTFRNLGDSGDLTCYIGHDNAGKNAGWCVSEVMVKATISGQDHLWRWTGEEWVQSGSLWKTLTLAKEY